MESPFTFTEIVQIERAMPEKEFVFEYLCKDRTYKIIASVPIPLSYTCQELVSRLVHLHKVPCFVEEELYQKVREFVTKETVQWHDQAAAHVVELVTRGNINADNLVSQWTKAFTEEVAEYSRVELSDNVIVFSEVYHAMVHSPALETLLNLEHKFAWDTNSIIERRNSEISLLEQRQGSEMERALSEVGITRTDSDITVLAQKHLEAMELLESKWDSELTNLKETQRRHYRDLIMSIHEDIHTTEGGTPSYLQKTANGQFDSIAPMARSDSVEGNTSSTQVESFTVHLGTQLKTTHNVRLLSANALDLCRNKNTKSNMENSQPQPQRILTALSLYSNSLCGLVLLVDNRLNSYHGIKKEFSQICERSTEFHFPELSVQLSTIEQSAQQAAEWRMLRRQQTSESSSDKISLKSIDKDEVGFKLQTGDFYVTRHSNLSEIHIVFHLVTDESIRPVANEISSRHPVIMGYRNIIRTALRYDINTLTLPLLLSHEMTEEMTIAWCLRRAELVFKCVKGFIMELATWNGQRSLNIQFLVPSTLTEDTFHTISAMLPSIFRTSNPVVVRSS